MIARLVLLYICFSIGSAAAQTKWVEYRPAGGGFRVEMPQTPQVESRTLQHKLGPLLMTQAAVDFSDRSFSLSYLDMPKDKIRNTNSDAILDGARDGAVNGMAIEGNKATLRSEHRLTVNGAPARDIIADIPTLHFVSVMRIILVGNRQYTVGFFGFAGSESKSEVNRFIESFVLLDSR
jgi:hypothetical protein